MLKKKAQASMMDAVSLQYRLLDELHNSSQQM
jgi:hypothetical protein